MNDTPVQPSVRPYRPFPSFDDWLAHTSVSPLVDDFRERLATFKKVPGAAEELLVRATRWAAIDTGAIENLYDVDRGFTISVAADAALLQIIGDEKGEAVEQAVADALAAYEFVLDLATTRTPISEVAVRELHQIVCRSQATYRVVTAVGRQEQDLPKGVYKVHENHPLNVSRNEVHSYAPVSDTPAEMARLVEELRTASFTAAHPVQQAAYAHFAFVAIHPFADGNGRVSRALASVFLYRDPGLPLVIFNDEKPEYLRALEAADDGRFQPFVSFVADRLIDTVNLLDSQTASDLPSIAEQAEDFARELNGRRGLTHAEVDGGATRLVEAFERNLAEVVQANSINAPLSASVSRTGASVPAPPTQFRLASTGLAVTLHLRSAAPAAAEIVVPFSVGIAKGVEGEIDYVLLSNYGDRLDVFLREVLPTVSRSLDLRLEAFAERVLRSHLLQLTEAARQTLRSNGYL